jgi:hypothetical protein
MNKKPLNKTELPHFHDQVRECVTHHFEFLISQGGMNKSRLGHLFSDLQRVDGRFKPDSNKQQYLFGAVGVGPLLLDLNVQVTCNYEVQNTNLEQASLLGDQELEICRE